MSNIHERTIKNICEEWQAGKAHSDRNVYSNTMRKKEYLPTSNLTRKLTRVLEVDVQRNIAWVEPSVTMDSLVAATLHYGLIPQVVPEFKGITVGGAINGAALESSSHLYGQFNDTCTSYELMIGNGSVIWANEQENRELFYGIASSYGTLGTLLSAKIKLIKACRYVKLFYHHCQLDQAFDYLNAQHESSPPPDFLEAIVYDATHVVVISGFLTDDVANLEVISLAEHWAPWFYSHAREAKMTDCMLLQEYVFRHDRGAFWMGGFAPDPKMSFSYFSHKASLLLGKNWDFSETFLPQQASPKNPGILFRSLFGWLMGSRTLYASLHGGSEEWFEKKFVIQDFYLPGATAEEFTKYALDKYKIQPIWICPILSTTASQFFSPHYREKEELLFDVGIYGLPANSSGPEAVRDLEDLTNRLDGRKMFYCHTYFTKEQFWQLYPYSLYKQLRERYELDKLSSEITRKVLK